jgi:5-methylcytosine-specific restriction endonuclease McrA
MAAKRRDRQRAAELGAQETARKAEELPRRARVLGIVASDKTFAKRPLGGSAGAFVWAGKCIHCNAQLSVALDGTLLGVATVEHIIPRHHGGGDSVENLALACARCNGGKGIRHDGKPRGDAKLEAMIALLQKRRAERWRDPAGSV